MAQKVNTSLLSPAVRFTKEADTEKQSKGLTLNKEVTSKYESQISIKELFKSLKRVILWKRNETVPWSSVSQTSDN